MTLTPEQELWLQALESGNYKQAKHQLKTLSNEYCCLGVACELFKEKLNLAQKPVGTYYMFNHHHGLLPPEVVDLLKLRSAGGYIVDAQQSLVDLNDSGKTFKEIAAIIRAHPERVFKNV